MVKAHGNWNSRHFPSTRDWKSAFQVHLILDVSIKASRCFIQKRSIFESMKAVHTNESDNHMPRASRQAQSEVVLQRMSWLRQKNPNQAQLSKPARKAHKQPSWRVCDRSFGSGKVEDEEMAPKNKFGEENLCQNSF